MRKRATIKDVAALAGVSPATVSRALDNRPEISTETKARVRDACAKLGYVPNAAARGLTGQATHTIGLVVPDISNPYFSGMATAIEQAAAGHGYRVFLSNSLRSPEKELLAVENFVARQVDGILISSISLQAQAMHREILGGLPCVYLGVNHSEDCSYVMADNESGAYLATRYLLRLGHRDILFLGGRSNSRTRGLRIQGFHRALAEAGLTGRELPAPPNVTRLRQWSYDAAAELRGVRIPEDVSLLGYDNIAFASLPRIALTTVSQHKYQQSRIAVDRLLDQISGSRTLTADLLEPELVIRSTCTKHIT